MEELTDMEIALTLATHINNPCSTTINGKNYHIRNFYLNLAKETLPNLTNEPAKEFLKSVIKKYE